MEAIREGEESQAILFSQRLGLRGKTEMVDLKKSLDNICCAGMMRVLSNSELI